MRSGSNDYHGSWYDYWSNEALNARRPWLHTRDRSRRHDWGFTLSGPLSIPKLYNARDKTFFLFSLEQIVNNMTVTGTYVTVPTDRFRDGDFGEALTGRVATAKDPLGRTVYEGTIYDPATDRVAPNGQRVRDPFPDNKIPRERFDPVAVKIQDLIPRANQPGRISNYLPPYWPYKEGSLIPAVKVDHNLSTKTKISFYHSRTDQIAERVPMTYNGIDSPVTNRNDTNVNYHTYRLSISHTLSPTMMLHLGAGHQGSWWPLIPQVNKFDQLKELGLRGAFVTLFPRITGLYHSTLGGYSDAGMGSGVASRSDSVKPTANASLTWVKSDHTYKFGAEMRIEGYAAAVYGNARGVYNFSAAQTAIPIPGFPGGGISIGHSYASFLLGLVDNGNIGFPTNARWGKNAWAIFAQDSWKATRKLTIDYGLRWDYQTYLREQYGRIPNFSPTTPNPSAGNLPGAVVFEGGPNPVKFAKIYPHAWGPRLGIAYQIRRTTVLRGGFGITYGQTPSDRNMIQSLTSSNPYSTASYGDPARFLSQGAPEPKPWPNFDPGQYPTPGTTTSPPFAFDHNAGRPPRQIQWSFTIQQEITRNLALEIGYVGNRGAWWEANDLLNVNALTAEGLAKKGIDINNASDRTLLTQPMNSPQVAARGFTAPYAGFPMTSTLAQALRPFPQFGTINYLWAPLGRTWYESLQVKVTKRYSHGLDLTSGFTWQKELMMGTEGWGFFLTPSVNDVFDRKSNKYLSTFDRPFSFFLALNYTTPRFAGFPKPLSWLLRDWTYGAILRYESGALITVPTAQNRLSSHLFRSTFANRVPGQPLFIDRNGNAIDINCKGCVDPFTDFLLNPNAWEDPPEGKFGVSAARFSDYRNRRAPSESMSLGRIFRITEKVNLSLRADFRNAFNRNIWSVTGTGNAKAARVVDSRTGETLSGFGYVDNKGGSQRTGLIVARISF